MQCEKNLIEPDEWTGEIKAQLTNLAAEQIAYKDGFLITIQSAWPENITHQSQLPDTSIIVWKRQHEHPLWSVINPGPPSGLWVSERTLIYRAGKTVRHVNLQNGAIVWETRLSDERGTNLLGAGKVLLVGSHAGYLHALDRESGHRLWSRDLWTSLKPGSFHVTVLGVYKEAVLLKIGKYVAMLIPNGQTSWPIPPPTPAHVPEPEAFE